MRSEGDKLPRSFRISEAKVNLDLGFPNVGIYPEAVRSSSHQDRSCHTGMSQENGTVAGRPGREEWSRRGSLVDLGRGDLWTWRMG